MPELTGTADWVAHYDPDDFHLDAHLDLCVCNLPGFPLGCFEYYSGSPKPSTHLAALRITALDSRLVKSSCHSLGADRALKDHALLLAMLVSPDAYVRSGVASPSVSNPILSC